MALLVALMAGTAVAKGKGKAKAKGLKKERVITYVFKGEISAVDTENRTVTVEVAKGNKFARSVASPGDAVTFGTTGSTKINVDGQKGAGFEALEIGQEVVVKTRAKANTPGVYVARLISATTPEVVEEEPIEETEPELAG